ncbi:MAG: hypothetical protein KC609_07090 [Myxococcales bacterium]|nr:hypothetical protein [Myxococcales bacterium]
MSLRSIVGNLAEHEAEAERQQLVEELEQLDQPLRRQLRRFQGLPTTQMSYTPPASMIEAQPDLVPTTIHERSSVVSDQEIEALYGSLVEDVPIDAPTIRTVAPVVVQQRFPSPTAPGMGTAVLRQHAEQLRRPDVVRRVATRVTALVVLLALLASAALFVTATRTKQANAAGRLPKLDSAERLLPFAKRDLYARTAVERRRNGRLSREGDIETPRMRRLARRRAKMKLRTYGSLKKRRVVRKRRTPGLPQYQVYRPTPRITITPLH